MGAAIIFTPTLSEEGILYLATLAREVLAVGIPVKFCGGNPWKTWFGASRLSGMVPCILQILPERFIL